MIIPVLDCQGVLAVSDDTGVLDHGVKLEIADEGPSMDNVKDFCAAQEKKNTS